MDSKSNCIFIKNYLPYQIYRLNEEMDIKDFAKKHKTLVQNCIYENAKLKEGSYVIVTQSKYIVHIVRPSETLETIANKYSKNTEYIKVLNKIDKIFIGQQLLI